MLQLLQMPALEVMTLRNNILPLRVSVKGRIWQQIKSYFGSFIIHPSIIYSHSVDLPYALRNIEHFHQDNNAPYLPPKILHKHCFQFLLGITFGILNIFTKTIMRLIYPPKFYITMVSNFSLGITFRILNIFTKTIMCLVCPPKVYITLFPISPGYYIQNIEHFHQDNNAPYLPPKILHKHCFQFLLGIIFVPREIEDNSYAKFGGKQGAFWSVLDRVQQMNSTAIPWRIFSYSLPKEWKTAYRRARWCCNTTHTKITKKKSWKRRSILQHHKQHCLKLETVQLHEESLAPRVYWEWQGWGSCADAVTTGIQARILVNTPHLMVNNKWCSTAESSNSC